VRASERMGERVDNVVLSGGCWMLDTGCWVLDTGYWVLDTGYWILGAGYWILGTGYWMLDTGYWMKWRLVGVIVVDSDGLEEPVYLLAEQGSLIQQTLIGLC
jgi:hypothetical protein